MKKYLIILGTAILGFSLHAQTGILDTRPANPSKGRILTMEETILSRELAPENLHCTWDGNKDILMYKDGQWITFNIETRLEKPYKPARKKEKVYTKGRSIYFFPTSQATVQLISGPDLQSTSLINCP